MGRKEIKHQIEIFEGKPDESLKDLQGRVNRFLSQFSGETYPETNRVIDIKIRQRTACRSDKYVSRTQVYDIFVHYLTY